MAEWTVASERLALSRSGVARRGAPSPTAGHGVLLLHGFGVPAATVAPLRRWFGRGGWDAATAPLGWNVACGEDAVAVVRSSLQSLAERSGQPVVLVGHSRGGLLGRVAALRHPELVHGLITVCTPWTIGPPDRPGVATTTRLVRFARRHGLEAMGSIECADGACCAAFRADMAGVPEAPWAALWSSDDTIGGLASVPPDGPTRTIDIGTSHLGAVQSVAGWTAISDSLEAFGLAAP